MTWKRRFRSAGVTLVFAQQGIISGHPDHKLQEGLYELIDEQRSDEAGMMISTALRQKYERGGVNGKPPIGYRRYRGEPGDPLNGTLVVDEAGARVVRRVFELYLGGHSIRSLVAVAEAEGLRSRLGGPLTRGSIEEILRNRTYIGSAVRAPGTPDEEVRDGAHEPLIDTETFEAVRVARLERRTRTNPGRRKAFRVYPLTNRSRCYYCGASYFGDTGSRTNKRRMRHAAGSCEYRRSYSAEDLEEQTRSLIGERLTLPSADIEVIAAAAVSVPMSGDPLAASRISGALEKLQRLYLWGDIDEPRYRAEREELERQLTAVAPVNASTVEGVEEAARYLTSLERLWDAQPPEGQRDIVNHLFGEIQIGDGGIHHVEVRDPYRQLLAAGGRTGRGGRI